MTTIALIPARYGSTRFPGKPLAMLHGKPIIQHVYEHVSPHFNETYVATDDEQIAKCIRAIGGNVVLTSSLHRNGTERCAEAYHIIATLTGTDYDWVINVQGDEPLVGAEQLQPIREAISEADADIITLAHPLPNSIPAADLANPNRVKVLIDDQGLALAFSREPISHHLHIGLYAYQPSILQQIVALPESSSERAQSLEQLRWLDAGLRIKVALTPTPTHGIDTPEDLKHLNLKT